MVDDVEEQHELAVAMLTKLNYSVTSADRGEESANNNRQRVFRDETRQQRTGHGRRPLHPQTLYAVKNRLGHSV